MEGSKDTGLVYLTFSLSVVWRAQRFNMKDCSSFEELHIVEKLIFLIPDRKKLLRQIKKLVKKFVNKIIDKR